MTGKTQPEKQFELLRLPDGALVLGISFPTIKPGINRKKIRRLKTAGGHDRGVRSEVDRLRFRTPGKTKAERGEALRRVSGRNQLVGRIESVRISGLMAEVTISIGDQTITSTITSLSAREMHLKARQAVSGVCCRMCRCHRDPGFTPERESSDMW